MPSKNPAQRLRDIVENIDLIEGFTAKMDRDDSGADRKTLYAVVRALEIISEAKRLQDIRCPVMIVGCARVRALDGAAL
jgi:uncharacterized protein with HEPN domain